ncbi:hypothetical protein BCR44DRAFT_38274 [Catenaria anguillulae PL171]|uniref:Transmembrane protein n=1 Tax=Catenaria anguillulae PL171 TaxID=765915 RepID=A0A1Y2HXW3_9FUNG|nr:hypothetical protein BCR44DRAFT_38274 [Catenaria anguillulae PL171]
MSNTIQGSIEEANHASGPVSYQACLQADHGAVMQQRTQTTPTTSGSQRLERVQTSASPPSPQSATSLSDKRHEGVPAIPIGEAPRQGPTTACGSSNAASGLWRSFAHSDSQVSDFHKLYLPVLETEHSLPGPQYSKSARDLKTCGHGHAGTPPRATGPTVTPVTGSAPGSAKSSSPSVSPSDRLSDLETFIPPPIVEEESCEHGEQESDRCLETSQFSVTPGTVDRRRGIDQEPEVSQTSTAPMRLSPIASAGRLFIPLKSSPHDSSSHGQLQPHAPGQVSKNTQKTESSWTFDSVKLNGHATELEGSKQLWQSVVGSQLAVAAVELKQTDYRISLWTLRFYSPEIEAKFAAFAKRIRTFPLAPFKWTLLIPIISQLIMVESSLQAYKLILQACPNVQGACIMCQSHVWTLVCIVSALLIAVLLFTSVGKAAVQRTRRQRLSLGLFILFVMVHLSGILCGGLCRLGPYKDDWTLVDGTIQLALTCAGRDPGGQASQGLQWLETSFQTRITSAYSYIYLLLAATQLSFLQVMGLGLFLLTFLAVCIMTVVPSTTSLLWLFLASLVQDVCKAAIASYQRDLLARACFLLVSTYQLDGDQVKDKLVVPPVLQQPLPQSSPGLRQPIEANIPGETFATRTTEPSPSVLSRAETSGASGTAASKPSSLLEEGSELATSFTPSMPTNSVLWWPRHNFKKILAWFKSKWIAIIYRFPQPEDEAAYVVYYRKKLVMRFRVMMILNVVSSIISMLLIFAVYQFLEPLGDGGWLDNWVLTDGVDVGVCLLLFSIFRIIRLDVATRIVEVSATLYAAVAIILAFANSMRRGVFQHENRAATLARSIRSLATIRNDWESSLSFDHLHTHRNPAPTSHALFIAVPLHLHAGR